MLASCKPLSSHLELTNPEKETLCLPVIPVRLLCVGTVPERKLCVILLPHQYTQRRISGNFGEMAKWRSQAPNRCELILVLGRGLLPPTTLRRITCIDA